MNESDDSLDVPRWRQLLPEQLEKAYSPSSVVGGIYQPFITEYSVSSEKARAACARVETIVYGSLPGNSIEIALPQSDVLTESGDRYPVLVFIHGGYWQEGTAAESFFGADCFTRQGIAYAAIDYTLAPDATLTQIVAECRSALDSIVENANSLGLNTDQVYIAGSSAGAHLCAMCCLNGAEIGTAPDVKIAGVILLSGVYELEPLISTSINDAIGLTIEEAQELSPQLFDSSNFPPAILTWGEMETDEFKRQSRAYARKLSESNCSLVCFETPGRNHFDIVHDMYNAESRLGESILNMIRRS